MHCAFVDLTSLIKEAVLTEVFATMQHCVLEWKTLKSYKGNDQEGDAENFSVRFRTVNTLLAFIDRNYRSRIGISWGQVLKNDGRYRPRPLCC